MRESYLPQEKPFISDREQQEFALLLALRQYQPKLRVEGERQYSTAFVIGRFQPFHSGHLFVIEEGLRIAKNAVICIGSANITDENNPWSPQAREERIRKRLERKKITPSIDIVYLDDYLDDDEWLYKTVEKTGITPRDVVVGNNDWVNDIFQNAGYKTLEVPLLNRRVFQGTTIRERVRKRENFLLSKSA